MASSRPLLCTVVTAFACSLWYHNDLFAQVSEAGAAPCNRVEVGSKVQVGFKLTADDDGRVLDSSDSNGILEFVCGDGDVVEAMDSGVLGMCVGETKAIPFGNEAGFGSRLDENVIQVDRDQLGSIPLALGKQVSVPTDVGERNAIVTALDERTVTLDFNHPLAGLNVTMTVIIVGCEAPPDVVVESLAPGDGQTYPKPGDKLTIHYIGSFAKSGNVFDSSREKGKPFEFQVGLGQVIKGLDAGVLKMSLGERALLRIPASMAFRSGNAIHLQKDVVFDVELLKIN